MAYHENNAGFDTELETELDTEINTENEEAVSIIRRNGVKHYLDNDYQDSALGEQASHWDEVEYYDALAASLGYVDEEEIAFTGKAAKSIGKTAGKVAEKQSKSGREDTRAISELAGNSDMLDERFDTTYKPARHEGVWLADSLRPLVERGLIRDVLMLVKGGKEANVYLCEGEPRTGHALIAAKVYRPRQFRNLRNDVMYREGREILNAQGNTIKAQTTNRIIRAVNKKTEFGAEVLHGSWLAHEFGTLEKLYAMGAAVPEPILSGTNSLLMEYIGDRSHAAPLLHTVSLDLPEAERLFTEVLANIELMLSHNMVHGDLSAYNILYWQGAMTIIDFPQVTAADKNNNAWFILQRDVQRVCEYFATQGVDNNVEAIAQHLWKRYVRQPMPA